MNVNSSQAKSQLSRLVDAAMNGEDVVIMKADKPCVRLMPIELPARKPGAAKAHAALTRAFLDPLPEEEIKAWDGR